jgi:hypothetical protein
MSANGFRNFWLSFCEGNPKKGSACCYKNYLFPGKIIPVTLFKERSGFLIATCSLKIVPKAACDPEN